MNTNICDFLKDFDKWNLLKQNIEKEKRPEYVHMRELWWCSLGVNIENEMTGKNTLFERPVLVLKKHNKNTCTVVPITSDKEESYFSYNFIYNNKKQSAILSQMKMIDTKRLTRKIGYINEEDFKNLYKKFFDLYKYENPFAGVFSEAEAVNEYSIAGAKNLSNKLL